MAPSNQTRSRNGIFAHFLLGLNTDESIEQPGWWSSNPPNIYWSRVLAGVWHCLFWCSALSASTFVKERKWCKKPSSSGVQQRATNISTIFKLQEISTMQFWWVLALHWLLHSHFGKTNRLFVSHIISGTQNTNESPSPCTYWRDS